MYISYILFFTTIFSPFQLLHDFVHQLNEHSTADQQGKESNKKTGGNQKTMYSGKKSHASMILSSTKDDSEALEKSMNQVNHVYFCRV